MFIVYIIDNILCKFLVLLLCKFSTSTPMVTSFSLHPSDEHHKKLQLRMKSLVMLRSFFETSLCRFVMYCKKKIQARMEKCAVVLVFINAYLFVYFFHS